MSLPAVIEPLAWLIGTWKTVAPAAGSYPSIATFAYHDELRISWTGQPMLEFSSRTTSAVTGQPMHRETGFLRVNPSRAVALILSHNFGLSSVEEGVCGGEGEGERCLELESTSIGRMGWTKEPRVSKIKRVFTLTESNRLRQTVFMATEQQTELTQHLEAEYEKVAEI
jgi:hypothetical protein